MAFISLALYNPRLPKIKPLSFSKNVFYSISLFNGRKSGMILGGGCENYIRISTNA